MYNQRNQNKRGDIDKPKHYSQSTEEGVILEYFNGFVGSLVDIGANDGMTFSNSRALIERGWQGVLVEPDVNAFAKLSELYAGHKSVRLYNYAICGFNGKAMLQQSSDGGLVSTFKPEEMERFKSAVSYTPEEVKCFTWKTAVNRWKKKHFECVLIDVEGSELEILPDIDLSQTKLLCIEWNSKPDLKTEYEKYTDGFKLLHTTAENLIYGR